MKGILSQAIIIGTCATGVAFIYSNGNLDISIGAVLGLAATLGVKAYNVTQSVVVMILATVAVALGLMAFNCTMSSIGEFLMASACSSSLTSMTEVSTLPP